MIAFYLISHFSILQPGVDELDWLLIVLNGDDDKVLDKCFALLDWLSDLKFAIWWIEEVINVLHVDLHERDADTEFIFIFGLAEVI